MASSGACWGIEVGAHAIKAVKLEPGPNNTANVLDFLILPHKKVLSTPGIDQNDALRVGLGEFASQVDLSGANVAVSVPGHSGFSRFAKLPPVEAKNVPDIVKFEAVQQIPFPIDEVEWDYQTFVDPNSPEIEVGIFAMTRERIMERLTQYKDVDLVPDFVTLAPVANYNALAYDLGFTEKTEGTIILDIGTTSTDLVVANSGGVWIRTFPIGGHHFTEALVNAFQLSYPKAEKLKKEAETSKHARHIFQAMRPVFGDLAQDVQRSIGYYQGLHKDAKLTRLIGLGSTFRLPGLRKYLKQQLGLDVYRLEQFQRVTMDGPRAGEFQANALNFATAVGLALQGAGSSTLNVNLMPTQVIREAMWKKKVKWFGMAAGLAAAASGFMFYRPFVDSQKVNAAQPDPIIRDTIDKANRLKSEAAEATASAEANYAPANVLSILDPASKRLMPMLLDDVSQLLAYADQEGAKHPRFDKAKAIGPVFSLKSFRPVQIEVMPKVEEGADPPTQEQLAAIPPTISVTLQLTSTQPNAQDIAIATIDKWLRANAVRGTVNYTLKFADPSACRTVGQETVVSVDAEVAEEGPAGEATGGGEVVAPGGRGAPSVPAPKPTGRRRGGRVAPDVTEAPKAAVKQQVVGTSKEEAARIEAQMASAAALNELSKFAPLPGDTAIPGGTKITTIQVEFKAAVNPPKDPNAKPEEGK